MQLENLNSHCVNIIESIWLVLNTDGESTIYRIKEESAMLFGAAYG